jgi:hypothetical protein
MYRRFASVVLNEGMRASRRSKLLLLAGFAVSAAAFAFTSRHFRVPDAPYFAGSLLVAPSPYVSLGVVAVTLVVCVLLGTLVAGTIRFDAGLFCALLGMMVLSLRAGRVGDVLRQVAPTGSPAVCLHLALELVALYALVAVSWSVLRGLHTGGLLKADEFRDGVEDTDEPLVFKVSALLMQVGVMAAFVLLLAQSDAKAQVMAAVAVGAFVGACAAYYMYPISPSPWLWVGPMVVGSAGYVLAYFNLPADPLWQTGQLRYPLAALARPLPLDYATVGPASAILGYWMSRRWHRERLAETAEPATA